MIDVTRQHRLFRQRPAGRLQTAMAAAPPPPPGADTEEPEFADEPDLPVDDDPVPSDDGAPISNAVSAA